MIYLPLSSVQTLQKLQQRHAEKNDKSPQLPTNQLLFFWSGSSRVLTSITTTKMKCTATLFSSELVVPKKTKHGKKKQV